MKVVDGETVRVVFARAPVLNVTVVALVVPTVPAALAGIATVYTVVASTKPAVLAANDNDRPLAAVATVDVKI